MPGEPLQSSLPSRYQGRAARAADLGPDVCLGPVLDATGAVFGLRTRNDVSPGTGAGGNNRPVLSAALWCYACLIWL